MEKPITGAVDWASVWNGSFGSSTGAKNTLYVAVYPDTTAAANDPGNTGTRATWWGRLRMQATPGGPGSVVAEGSFALDDFVVTHGPGALLTVAPKPGLTCVVNGVPDTSKVTLKVFAGPEAHGLPGHSPVLLVVLVLLLAGAGIVLLRMRRRLATA